MSLYGEALRAVRLIILVEDRMKSLAQKVDRLSDDFNLLRERVVRLEAIMEIALQSRAVQRRGPTSLTDDRG